MKTRAFFLLALVGLASIALNDADAGSAVVLGPHNQLATAYGGPVRKEEQRALENARRKYGANVRILAASDVTGYGAIAIAKHPNGNWLIGVALGRRSATEANTLAINECLKAGGKNPQVRWAFRG
ncbi:MAG: hypothetical protein QOI53_3981 [Verrucomicrobiota bacterium]|jgi:hypothetical protein|nr:hypothetical protein [Verrucomicrobiota bacterium]